MSLARWRQVPRRLEEVEDKLKKSSAVVSDMYGQIADLRSQQQANREVTINLQDLDVRMRKLEQETIDTHNRIRAWIARDAKAAKREEEPEPAPAPQPAPVVAPSRRTGWKTLDRIRENRGG